MRQEMEDYAEKIGLEFILSRRLSEAPDTTIGILRQSAEVQPILTPG